MKLDSIITADLRINEVINSHPGTVGVFHAFGLDSCCGGNKTLAEAATAHGIELEALLEALERVREPAA